MELAESSDSVCEHRHAIDCYFASGCEGFDVVVEKEFSVEMDPQPFD